MGLNEIYDQIDRLTEELLELIDKMQAYAENDPAASVNKARQIAEMICLRTLWKNRERYDNLWKKEFDTTTRKLPMLKEMLGSHYLGDKEDIMPRGAYLNADYVREWGNMGSHINSQSRTNLANIQPLISAVKGLIEWFCKDNGICIPDGIWRIINEEPVYSPLRSTMPNPRIGFVGREEELEEIHRLLREKGKVFICGMGGIGKSQLAKKYAERYASEYDVKIFANYAFSIRETIASDSQIPIEDMERGSIALDSYYHRKMATFNHLANERVLLVLDNFDVLHDDDLAELLSGNYKLIITSRTDFEEYISAADYDVGILTLGTLSQQDQLRQIFFNNYKKRLNQQESEAADQLIALLEGHTMALEIVAKQMSKSRKTPSDMVGLLQGQGLRSANLRERIYHNNPAEKKTGYEILKALFSLESLTQEEQMILSDLALVPNSGIDTPTFYDWCGLETYDDIESLIQRNWILHDVKEDIIHLHPLVSEVVLGELVREFPLNSRMMQHSFFSNYTGNTLSWLESNEKVEKRAAIILKIKERFPQITAENEEQFFIMALTLTHHGGYKEHISAMIEAVARERFKKYNRFDNEIFEIMFHLMGHSPKCRSNWSEFEKMCFENIQYWTEHDQYHISAQLCLSMGYIAIERGDLDRVKNCMELTEKYYLMISPEKDRCGRGTRGTYTPTLKAFGGNVYHFMARAALTLGNAEQALEYQQQAAEILLNPALYLIDEKTKRNPQKWLEMNKQHVVGAFGRIYEALGRWDEAKRCALEKENTLLKYRHPTHYNFMSAYISMLRVEQHLGNADKIAEYKEKLKKTLDAKYLPEEDAYLRLTKEFGLDE